MLNNSLFAAWNRYKRQQWPFFSVWLALKVINYEIYCKFQEIFLYFANKIFNFFLRMKLISLFECRSANPTNKHFNTHLGLWKTWKRNKKKNDLWFTFFILFPWIRLSICLLLGFCSEYSYCIYFCTIVGPFELKKSMGIEH